MRASSVIEVGRSKANRRLNQFVQIHAILCVMSAAQQSARHAVPQQCGQGAAWQAQASKMLCQARHGGGATNNMRVPYWCEVAL